MSHDIHGSSSARLNMGRLRRAVDTIGSIWCGVVLLALIFIYSSIGSAVPPIRQGILADWLGLEILRFEKSEMEWFTWWPFQFLLTLFCTALIIATIRRVRFTVVNFGVWVIHTGIIVLTVCSAFYFHKKVEGDAPIFQSRMLVMVPGMNKPASVVVRPGASLEVGSSTQFYHLSVANIIPNYEILTGEHKGERTQAIWLQVESLNPAQDFMRVLLVGYPDYTEDVLTGAGGAKRAVKVTGKRLLDETLNVQLDYDPVDRFYHMDTAAVYVRSSPTDEWTQLRIRGLPSYYEHISRRDGLKVAAGEPVPPLRPLDLRAQAGPHGNTLASIDVHVTDFLPYASFKFRDESNPHKPAVTSLPMIVPRHQRQSLQQVGQTPSVIRVEVNDGQKFHSVWLPFNQYAFKDVQWAQPGRFTYNTSNLKLSDGRSIELMYSRWSDPLPTPVALDRFILRTHPGGDRPRDYISLIRFADQSGWSPIVEVKSNNPAQHGDLWYFQAQWDPGTEAYTVLGVGNREGVHGMLAGVLISIAGMIYTFYVKPGIIRRRKQRALSAASQLQNGEDAWAPLVHREIPCNTHAEKIHV